MFCVSNTILPSDTLFNLCFSQLKFIACVFSGRPTSSYEGKQIGNEINIRYATYKVNICNVTTGLIKRLFIYLLTGTVMSIYMALFFMLYNTDHID